MNHVKTAPLLQSQLGIYLQCKRLGGTAYNQHWLYILDDAADTDRLAAAIDRVMAFYPSLNIRLREQDGEPVQYIPEAEDPYRQRVESMTEEEWEREKADLVSRPMELLDSRLLCFHVVRTERAKYLFQSAHHVLFDGRAMQRLADVISEAYAGNGPGAENCTVLDAAAAEAEERQGPAYRKAGEWYEQHFSGIDAESMPIPDRDGKDDFKACIRLLPVQEAEITAFCRGKGYSTSALTSGAFAVTMGICTNRQEALFSTIWNGRDTAYADSFGMFVKTLPAYASWNRETTTADFLSGMTEMIRESRENSLFSYADLNQFCPMEQAPMFAWHGRFRDIPSLCGFPCRQEVLDSALDDTPLSADLMATDDGLSLRIEYNAGKYSDGFVEILARTYAEILAQLMTKETLGAIEPCPGGTADGDFNETAFPVKLQAVHTLMEAQAERNPDKTAFVAAGERLSYRELNEKANRLAHSLQEMRPKGDEFIVGILLPRTTAVPVAEYGVWKAGGAFLPMSAEYPDDRVETCLRDAGCAFCITTEAELRKRPVLFSADKPYQALTVESLCENPKGDNPGLEVPASALAYVIYTSGSTGRPKGVMLEHGNLCNFLDANEKNPETRAITESGSVMLSVAAISFDFSMMELHIPLCHGGTCVMATEEEILNAGPLAQLITREHVDEMCCTPSFFSNALQFDGLRDALRGIRLIDFGAEAFPPALYHRIREAGLETRILNGYGPTEATISCICREITGDEKITIGAPAANVRAWVMDPYGHELPAGAAGELVVGGLGVGRGYMNLKEKTEAVFFEYKGEHAYRTGDIVRLLPDEKQEGKYTLDYLGRGDRQVKIRGF
ncbi:MAG: amino acid adenylation domain-containing protein, partial [Clostridia bacterium]